MQINVANGKFLFLLLLLAAVAAVASLLIPSVRVVVRGAIPAKWIVHLNGYRFGYEVDYSLRIAMHDGIELAASLYLPRSRPDNVSPKLPTVLVRLPYNRLKYGEGLRAAEFFASHGYAVLIQDLRGTNGSGGKFVPYQHATADGVATLDWIARQNWSNGKVGTYGCSALGETQFSLARARHPSHAAMIASGAGGALGSAMGRYSYFGVFEGGIFQLASAFGWFAEFGYENPGTRSPHIADLTSILHQLPVNGLVRRITDEANSYSQYLSMQLSDPAWSAYNFVAAEDRLRTPSLTINTWGDQTVGDALTLAEFVRLNLSADEARRQHVIIAPGTHCHHEETGRDGRFGELQLKNAGQPYFDWYLAWFDHFLKDKGEKPPELPAYLYYVIGEGKWLSSSTWPPESSIVERWYLSSGGAANSRSGDGVLAATQPLTSGYDKYVADPMNPVPSRGGPLCCTGNPEDRAGPADQRDVEDRRDVLVYTSHVLEKPLRIAGRLRARLIISSTAPDSDFVARLVHVWPDGRATSIQEGALRARYRNGIDNPLLLPLNQSVELSVDMRSIAYYVPAGHRLRMDIASSSFPRLERNLQTGGRNYDETIANVAENQIHHGPATLSWLEIPVLP